jgi:arsenate reductase
MSTDKPEIFFVCIGNAGRSQMAAAFTRVIGGSAVGVRSAGSVPERDLHPLVVEAMREIGIDVSAEVPKGITDEAARAADVVITMGCGDACPIFPGKRYLDWELEDPAGKPIDTVRAIRDDIRGRVLGLLSELGIRAA